MLWTKQDPPFIMRLTQQGSPAGPQAFEGKHVSEKRGEKTAPEGHISLFVLQGSAAKFRLCQKIK